ncbi:hypothetical protein VHEMI00541 [[Torrubiella] hemipterigena]|uniref:Uncharacterized protein n=1 Tax=[Torrubiella] hemipterigena TaxID=1531966 RepID=A0A0A1SJI1_9HYPO|nr:hypothetical protein VHEMI00541 [[Torrubiella] hemipterigena]
MTVEEASCDAANQERADRSPSLALASPPQALCDNLQQIPRACLATNNDEELLSHFNWHTLSFEDSACDGSPDSYIFGATLLYGNLAPDRVTRFNDTVNVADFLASFDFSGNSTAHPSERYCLHLEDVKTRLRTELDGNVSAGRAQLVETTIDIASRARLEMDAVPLDVNNQTGQTTSEVPGESDAPSVTEAPNQSAPAKREVMASEAASKQPTQDPELQTAVSNSLMKAVSEVDACTWELESMALEKDGWTFGFACSQAWRCWTKHDNSLGALAICDYSKKTPEATAADRPAFDCCGTISVSFKRSNKTIKMTYSHIPIHKTVGSLWKLFQPAEPPIPVLGPSPKKRTPAKSKPSVAGAKRNRKSGTESGTTPKKRNRKTKDKDADPSAQLTLEQNMASLAQEVQRLSSTDEPLDQQPSNRTISPAALAEGSAAQAWSISGISAGEATRRREVAAKLLSENGVDASTLSADQFSVLSNQAPDLQKKSIEMLVKYGAESLRIVQPGSKSTTKTTSPPTTNEIPAGPIIFQTTGKRQRTKSRVICFNCKASKSKVKVGYTWLTASTLRLTY